MDDEPPREPAGLTESIIWRIAAVETRRREAMAVGGGASARLLAGLGRWPSGLRPRDDGDRRVPLFPAAIRAMAARACLELLGQVERGVGEAVVGSSSWLAWAVWVVVGVCLAIWFAGGEVRAGWRRTLTEWLPR